MAKVFICACSMTDRWTHGRTLQESYDNYINTFDEETDDDSLLFYEAEEIQVTIETVVKPRKVVTGNPLTKAKTSKKV